MATPSKSRVRGYAFTGSTRLRAANSAAWKPWMCGKYAANVLAEKIGRRSLACEERDRDRYGRIVARCSVAGEDLGEWMVANGWAVAYYLYSYEYSRAEHRAKSARRGIWASEFVKPWEWRRGKRLDTGD